MNAASEEPSPVRPGFRRYWYVLAAALGFGSWWIGSILLHALLFGALFVAGPKAPESPDAASDDFQMTISPDHVASVVADIREQQKEEFTKKIEELASVKAQLDALNAVKIEQYNALMRDEAAQAPQMIRQAEAEVRASQEKALQAQATAQTAVGKMNAAQKRAAEAQNDAERAAAQQELKDSTQAARDAQATASQAQGQASAAQTKLTRQINLFGDEMAAARQASGDATTAQTEAQRQQDAAVTTRQQWEADQRKLEQQAAELQRLHTATAAASQRVTDLENRLVAIQPPTPTPPPTPPPSDGDAAATPAANPASTPTPAPSLSKQAKQETDRLNKALAQSRDAQGKVAAREADAGQKFASAQESADRRQQKLQEEQDQAHLKQQNALEAQTKAGQTILTAAEKPSLAPVSATASAAAPPTAPPNANLADLFHQAQQMESAVAESYRNVRAAELAALRKIPLAQATALTEVAKPVRAEIDTAVLARDIRDVQGVRIQEKALTMASEQMNSMVALAQRMRELAQPTQTTVSVADMKAASRQTERMERLAQEDEGTKAKDLTAAMQGGNKQKGRGNGHGNDEAFARATADLLNAALRVTINPADAKARLEYESAVAAMQALINESGAGGEGTANRSAGSGGAGNNGDPDGPQRAGGEPGVPAIDPRHFKPIPGRTITTSMIAGPEDRQREWMFVDSWHIIGPWPNPGRKNLDTKFPPETVVDLDATYTGGRRNEVQLPVRWHFHQTSAVTKNGGSERTGMIVPPGLDEFEIYYAYTELWLDEAADLWVAIGSDDQSKVWLNDQMIWKSADYYKSWVANEGLRKVHFNKGINRVLLRLENGQFSGGYSLMVCLDPKVPPPPEAQRAGQR